ncbi:MAG TPA: TIR domain-containing protein [Opitutaceae bacterium]|nr:TIR domain-containing protein [Opitutaceae bacterium]
MPDPASSTARKAVFLSYAREDGLAAQRIADALGGFGIEAWFDQSELRGGDAWDEKIRRQIKECAVFVPIISANTQARGEGYFRLEWKLAVDRSHLMAENIPFLLPVAIDSVTEEAAIVPAEFRRVQWTRLAGGRPTPAFVELVRRILEGVMPEASPKPRHGGNAASGPTLEAKPANSKPATAGRLGLLLAGVAAAAAIVAALVAIRRAAPTATAIPTAAPAEAAPVSDKSIAVLPFANMSEDKDNAFFADGIHEDVLTDLALIHDLRVVSRTSVEQYRDTTKPIREIGRELGVAYILEGSVQRAGARVRVTGQLIRAATDEHVWAQAYDGDLTDVFAIQSQIAQAIAGALATAISPQERNLLERRPTQNAAAYDAFVKGREIDQRADLSDRSIRERIALFNQAVRLDPAFASAWGELADAYAFGYFQNLEGRDDFLAQAKAAIERAQELAPDDPDIQEDLGTYYYYGYRDFARATEIYQRLAALRPNDPTIFNALGLLERRQGRWPESIASMRRATELDPSNLGYLENLCSDCIAVKRLDEAAALKGKIAAMTPDVLSNQMDVAEMALLLHNDPEPGRTLLGRLTSQQRESPQGINLRLRWAEDMGDWAEAVRLDRQQPFYEGDGTPHYEQALWGVLRYAKLGDHDALVARAADFPAQLRRLLETEPDNFMYRAYLGCFEILLGQKEAGLRDLNQACELLPVSSDAVSGPQMLTVRAYLRAWAGDKDGAIRDLTELKSMPESFLTIQVTKYTLDRSTIAAPLASDPRFQALLASPDYLKPLF